MLEKWAWKAQQQGGPHRRGVSRPKGVEGALKGCPDEAGAQCSASKPRPVLLSHELAV